MVKTFTLKNTDALLVTDVQNDFLSGGTLPVLYGDEIIQVLNEYIHYFKKATAQVLASRDWHPANHISFKAQGGKWPPHCVQETEGAKFHRDLKLPRDVRVISKATRFDHEAYSAFDETNLLAVLKELNVNRFFIGGLATDYCIVNTVLDARKLGYETVVLMDAVRGIEANPGDIRKAVNTMAKAGAEQATVESFPEPEDTLPLEEDSVDALEEKPSAQAAVKKKARLRPKDARRKIPTEQ